MRTARTVLLVADEPDLREAASLALQRRGYRVHTAADAPAAEAALAGGLPDLLVAEMMLPGASGFQVVRLVAERSDGRVPVVMMSAAASPPHRDYAFAAGADVFLAKPFSLAELARTAEELCPMPAPRPVSLAAAGS